ncbi:MAG: peptidoglycan DD-metalloendopeptidase family protein [Actinomycetaceae bacterium]
MSRAAGPGPNHRARTSFLAGLALVLILGGATGPAFGEPSTPDEPGSGETPTSGEGGEDATTSDDELTPSDDPLLVDALRALRPAVTAAPAAPLPVTNAPPSSGGLSGPLGHGTYALTSYMGPRCIPVLYGSSSHGGIDMGAAAGTPMYAIADGVVVNQLSDPVAGQWLLVRHVIDGRYVFASYSHTTDFDRYVRTGDRVTRGQRIADVGTTGVSTGPHLHFEMWLDAYLRGTRVEPMAYFAARGVDLRAAAVRALPQTTPASCGYYAIGSTPIRSAPSAGASVLTMAANYTAMTGWPGDKTGDWVHVRVGGVTGWAHAGNVSPVRTREPDARAARATTVRSSRQVVPGNEISTVSAGTRIEEVGALVDGWYRISVGGTEGWVPAADVTLTAGVRRGIDEGFFLANSFRTSATTVFSYGEYYDRFYVGDFDGNGTDTFAYRRDAVYRIRNTNSPGNPDVTIAYGRAEDEVLVGDWDGDGTDTLAVRRGNEFHLRNSLTSGPADVVLRFGRPGDEVLVGDWDGNGTDTLAVRRGSRVFVLNTVRSGPADVEFSYGRASDAVYVGDFDGDGSDSFAVRRGATYFVRNSLSGGAADVQIVYGRVGDETYVGDWDGDGADTLGIYRFF